MKPRILLLWSVLCIVHASAQTSTINISNSGRFRMASLGAGNGYLIASERRFSFDSSWVEMIELDASWNATTLATRRYSDPLWFLFDGVQVGSGMAMTGTLTSSYVPQLVRFGLDGTPTWTKNFSGMTHSQTRIAMLFTDGSYIFGFTNADNLAGNGVYRIECEGSIGANTSITEIATADNSSFRLYCGTAAEFPQIHVLGGTGVLPGSFDNQALLGRFALAGASWMKHYQLGSTGAQEEEVTGVVRMTGGGYACAMNATATSVTTDGFFMRVDDNGALIDCVKLSDVNGVYLSAIHQLYDGSFLLAGSTNGGVGMLYKLSGTGTLLWAQQCTSCFFSTINSFYTDPFGELFGLGPGTLYRITPDGDACGFAPASSVTAAAFTPVITDLIPVNTPSPPVTVGTQVLHERVSTSSATTICGPSAIEAAGAAGIITAFPNPVTTLLHLGEPGATATTERIILRDITGAVCFDGAYGAGIDVSALSSGLYTCEIARTLQRVRIIKQ